MSEVFAIVGASLAGGTAAVTLREEGFEGRVVLIGEEPQPPYDTAAVGMNRGRDIRRSMQLIRARRAVAPEQLRDDDGDLRKTSVVKS